MNYRIEVYFVQLMGNISSFFGLCLEKTLTADIQRLTILSITMTVKLIQNYKKGPLTRGMLVIFHVLLL